jgi:RNA recognition motif-containing protein
MQGGQDGGPGGRQGPSGHHHFDPVGRALYVGNLHFSVTEAVLQEIFSGMGPVSEVKIIKDKASGQSSGYGFVKFFSQEHANNALHKLNGQSIFGQVRFPGF